MTVLAKNKTLSLGRMLFIDKESYQKEQLEVDSTGPYKLEEKDDCFVIQNMDCCKSIMVTVKVKGDKAENPG
ncbi:MAG: hypothetical protein FH756_03345 [Firmicutes bacterium]|nr:hypothetical protein [Bacillota bacterium]